MELGGQRPGSDETHPVEGGNMQKKRGKRESLSRGSERVWVLIGGAWELRLHVWQGKMGVPLAVLAVLP